MGEHTLVVFPAQKRLRERLATLKKDINDKISAFETDLNDALNPVVWLARSKGFTCETKTDTIQPFYGRWKKALDRTNSLEAFRTMCRELLTDDALDECWRTGSGNCIFHVRKYIYEIEQSVQHHEEISLSVLQGKTPHGDDHFALLAKLKERWIFLEPSFAFKVSINPSLGDGSHTLKTDKDKPCTIRLTDGQVAMIEAAMDASTFRLDVTETISAPDFCACFCERARNSLIPASGAITLTYKGPGTKIILVPYGENPVEGLPSKPKGKDPIPVDIRTLAESLEAIKSSA